MNINILQWRYSPFLLLGLGMFGFSSAQAQVLCSASSMTPLTFGNVDPLSSQTDANATFSMVCRNNSPTETRAATVCLSIGQPIGQPRQMTNGSNQLNFQLYKDALRTETWGSQFAGALPSSLQFNITLGPNASNFPVTQTLYGRVLPGQTAVVPGSYTKSYPADNNARVTIEAPTNTTVPNTCNQNPTGSLYFGFKVSATVPKKCEVTTQTAPINLGSKPASDKNILGNSVISIRCTNTTPYNIGLTPSPPNGNTSGGGLLNGTPGNTDKMAFQLFSDAARTKKWGKTASASNVGNGVKGININGSAQNYPVYATVPSADFKPDNYSDTVTINLNY